MSAPIVTASNMSALAKGMLTSKDPAMAKKVRDMLESYRYRWAMHRRPSQWVDDNDDWTYWFFCAGRGAGKTRSGAEKVREWAERGVYQEVALIAPTHDDVEKVMLNGPAGLMRICPPWYRPTFNTRTRILQWPDRVVLDPHTGRVRHRRKGMTAFCHSAEKPEKFRGPQFQAAWADELCAWRFPLAWELMAFGIRLPPQPRVIITSTPKPTPLIRELMGYKGLRVTTGTTYDNKDNLAGTFFDTIIKRFEGTRLGMQELLAKILDDNPNALWKTENLQATRLICPEFELPDFDEIVVGVDPNISSEDGSDECGIVVSAKMYKNGTEHYYTLEDASLNEPTPEEWGQQVVKMYRKWKCDKVIAESNQGGEMVRSTVRNVDKDVDVEIIHAKISKAKRAQPVAQLNEQGRSHLWGLFPELEGQMLDWNPREDPKNQASPDRMDAMVWGHLYLMGDELVKAGVIK